ncbi:AAEL014814-PA [Aedes aegypti]|uniref:AAEL014814-PA n=1 Tax=Aedes aegypti TaxID=7159 RepID=Q16FD6_AEDAE|nr:AAEL014814-PA [Aedes aegypti]
MEPRKDYFVVVQTKEAGKLVLTAVPYRWIRDGFLFWPGKNANRLRMDLNSEPGSGWSKIACSVKRKYIPSYEEAEIEAAELSGQNTESSDSAPQNSTTNMQTNQNQSTGPEPTRAPMNSQIVVDSQDLPDVAPSLLCSAGVNQVDETFSTHQTVDHSVYLTTLPFSVNEQQTTDEMQKVATEGESEYVYFQQPTVDMDSVIKAVSGKIEEECSKMQDTILSTMSTMMASFKSDMDVKLAAALRAQAKPSDDEKFTFSPVSSIEQIHELEKNLADDAYAERFISYMKKIVGYVGDNCNGMNISYTLVDLFFERNVMLKCSWSGASRSSIIKLAIKNCTKILDIFFTIVRSVNITFSRQLLAQFFKQVTRNAKKRSEAKGLRQPTIHRRAKKLNNTRCQADVPPTTTSDGTKSDWSPSTEDESQSSKSSSSDESDSEMLVSKVEESDPRINSC